MADEGKSLGQLVAALQQEYGPHYYARRDLRVANDIKTQPLHAPPLTTEDSGPTRFCAKKISTASSSFWTGPQMARR